MDSTPTSSASRPASSSWTDDPQVARFVQARVLRSFGFRVKPVAPGRAFLAAHRDGTVRLTYTKSESKQKRETAYGFITSFVVVAAMPILWFLAGLEYPHDRGTILFLALLLIAIVVVLRIAFGRASAPPLADIHTVELLPEHVLEATVTSPRTVTAVIAASAFFPDRPARLRLRPVPPTTVDHILVLFDRIDRQLVENSEE